VQQAARDGSRLKLIASVRSQAEALEIRVEPVALPLAEPLSRVEGVMNALTIETDTVREITIIGPGAGPEQAGQGLFADLVAVLRAPRLLG
jgi:homoserine dehydrogenase